MRAIQVAAGCCLIFTVWAWMILSINVSANGWSAILTIVSKMICAAFITAPIYREYLR